MKHLAPACFRAFACAGGACPDSCCRAGWEIVPDEETLALYQTLPGEIGERIQKGIVPAVVAADPGGHNPRGEALRAMAAEVRGHYGNAEPLLRQDSARVCVLLDADGLCCVQKHFGHGALCRVCREYPRFHREFGGLTEHGLSLSCPTAYALATAAPPAWEKWEDEAPVAPNELDPETYLRLRKGRELALELLTREELPLWRRAALVRRLAAAMQGAPERIVRHDYEIRLRRWLSAGNAGNCQFSIVNSQLRRLAQRFLALEILSPAWKDALERFVAMVEAGELPDDASALFEARTAECRPYRADALRAAECRPCIGEAAPEAYARWLWYELYKYWLDALDDGDLLGRVDRSLDMLLLGMAMDRALPGEGPFLRRISREIEHCEENLAALLQ